MNEILYRLLQESTVRIETNGRISGTGTFVAPKTVLTRKHVTHDRESIRVYWFGQSYDAIVSNVQNEFDISLLHIKSLPSDHPCVYLHDSIRPGDILYSFGYPVKFEGGDSSRFECEGLSVGPTLIKFTRGQVLPGLSGAPLLNERTGGVCGIIKQTRDRSSILGGRAIPIGSVLSAFPFIKEQQREYHNTNTHWARFRGTREEVDKSLKLGNIVIPPGHNKLIAPLEAFLADNSKLCEDYYKNVFIMTRFQPGNKTLEAIDKTLRDSLRLRGLVGHRADDRCYPTDRNLWDNVCTYMVGCKYGVAVLENILQDEFNPNVALEYGFMRALGKSTLLLKEKRMAPRADILGTLWEEFDILDIEGTIKSAVNRWLDDCGV